MKTKNLTPQLTGLIIECEKAIKDYVTEEHINAFASSWYVKYSCEIDCSEELNENLRLNVTFDLPYVSCYSVGTYVSKNQSINAALEYINICYLERVKESEANKQKKGKEAKDTQILELIKQGKTEDALKLANS